MSQAIRVISVLLVTTFGAMSASAHDSIRVIGTVTKVSERSIGVTTREGAELSMPLTADTEIMRGTIKVSLSELKPGNHVVIDAYGDSALDAEVLGIRIVPTITAPPK